MGEIIDLPSDRLSEKRVTQIQFELQSFPGQRFRARFEWNTVREVFTVQFTHLDRNKTIIRSPVLLYRFYSYLPWTQFFFLDPSFSKAQVTPENLGEDAHLFAIPGPNGQPINEWDDKPSWFPELKQRLEYSESDR